MSTTTISTNQEIATLVNVFTVEPGDQQALVDLLVEATEETMRHRPGFISANIHASLDRTKVVNYAQWASPEDFQAMLADPLAQEHMASASTLAAAQPALYTVVSVHRV